MSSLQQVRGLAQAAAAGARVPGCNMCSIAWSFDICYCFGEGTPCIPILALVWQVGCPSGARLHLSAATYVAVLHAYTPSMHAYGSISSPLYQLLACQRVCSSVAACHMCLV